MKKFIKNILIFVLIFGMLVLSACHETPVVPNEPEDPTPNVPNTDAPGDPPVPDSEGDLPSDDVPLAPAPSDDPVPPPTTETVLPVDGFTVFENFDEKINPLFIQEYPTGSVTHTTPYPLSRVFTITSKTEYDQIFTEAVDTTPIDYDKEMYILYTSTETRPYVKRKFVVLNASISEKHLTIRYEYESPYGKPSKPEDVVYDSCKPFQRFALIRMEKMDLSEITFKLIWQSWLT